MPDRVQSYKVICGGGLNSNENHLDLSDNSPGSATRLVNYEVSLFGGYRRVEGFEPYDSTYAEVDPTDSEGKVLSVAIYNDDNLNDTVIIAARKVKTFTYTATASQTAFTGADGNSRTLALNNTSNIVVKINGTTQLSSAYSVTSSTVTLNTGASAGDIVTIDPSEYNFFKYVAGSGWTKYSTGITHKYKNGTRTVDKLRHVTFNFGDGNRIAFADGTNPALVFDGSNWKELTTSGSGTDASPGGPNTFAAPTIIEAFENHLFVGADTASKATIGHSAPNAPLDFTTANGAGQLAVGFDVVQFKPFRGDLFVFGTNGIKRASPDVTSGFVIDQITTNVGCIARDSVLELGGDLVFLAPDGLRPVAGTSRIGDVELETISKDIQQLLTDIPRDFDLNTLDGVVIRSKSQLRYFIGDDGDANTVDSFGIIGGLRSADQRLGWEFGELLGIRASCCTSEYVDRQEIVLHGDYNGKVYKQESGDDFDGEDILSVYATPFFDFGDTEVKKVMRKINTFIRAEGPLTFNLSVQYDWEDPNTARPRSYTDESEGAPVRYRGTNINFGGTNVDYGGASKPVITTNVQGTGYATQATFVTLGTFKPHSIQGIVFEFSIAGRR